MRRAESSHYTHLLELHKSNMKKSLDTIKTIINKIGSIEKNKEATFFISEGDALDIRSNNVTQIFIKGKSISTDNHQKRLFEKYRKDK